LFSSGLQGFRLPQPANRNEILKAIQEVTMGRGILLWLLGIPIPIIILIMLFWR
jgi:hypothetical protein